VSGADVEPLGTGGDNEREPVPYPHLAPELRTLTGDALDLWGVAPRRREALLAILTAWEAGSPELGARVARVDAAIEAGLRAVGLPRGPVRAVQVVEARGPWLGRKDPDCTLLIAGDAMRQVILRQAQPDATFRTWVHESLHARLPYAAGAGTEYRAAPGYEEGVAEGLARLVVHAGAGVPAVAGSFDYYVRAYAVLAQSIGVEAAVLWRALWEYSAGAVRAALPSVVDRLRRASMGQGLDRAQRARLQGIADQVFRGARSRDEPDSRTLGTLWRLALR
jgi:hypothetical protein